MKKTKGPPIQFRLALGEMEVLERLAAAAGLTAKDYVVALTLAHIASASS